MTENNAITIIQIYLQNHGFLPKKIDTTKLGEGKKSPDLEVKENQKLVFYCEVKTPDLRLNEATQIFHWSTTHSKLRGFIHTAVKQFKDRDPNHSLPWVLAFTSSNFQLNWSNFAHCIEGVVAYNGNVVKDLSESRFIKDTNSDLKEIDLFVWCQVNEQEKKIYQMVHFVNHESVLLNESEKISRKLTPHASENIVDKNTKAYA